MKAGIALGSNVGDRLENLRAARRAVVDLAGVTRPILSSTIYETDPVDCEPGAAKFLNAAMEFEFDGDPISLLQKLRQIETLMGRPADRRRNTPRKIDIDLLYLGGAKIESEQLRLPHPRMHLRRFVLQPLADIRPELVWPGQTKSVRELLALTDESAKVVRLTNDWGFP